MQTGTQSAIRQPPVEAAATVDPARRGSVVDLFCGAGGLSHGFRLEGFDLRAGIDVDATCRHAYEHNNQADFLTHDVSELSADTLAGLFVVGQPKVLVGCAPCQPFSQYSQNQTDTKWRLLRHFGRLINEVKPEVVSMENVPRLTTFQGGTLFDEFLSALAKAGYHDVWSQTVDCLDFGVPQTRKRLVVLASRIGPISLPESDRRQPTGTTVRETIGHLPAIPAGGRDADDPLHRASGLSPTNLERIRAAAPGQTWREWGDPGLRASCHQRASGRWYGNVYGRMSWDEAAPTLTTQCNGFGNGRFGHPEQDRAISLREAALLQTFPATYEFFKPGSRWSIADAARSIGNAVPVSLARAIARSVATTLDAARG